MKAFRTSVVISFLTLLLFCGCERRQAVRIRTTVESSASSSMATASVYLEGSDGNALTGAVVLVTTMDNIVTKLDFDTAMYCYRTKTLPLSETQGYRFSVQSNANRKTISYTIPHRFLSTAPAVTLFEDSAGHSVLSGTSLDSAATVQIAWSPSANDCVYQISIKDAVQTLYSTSTAGTSVQIPAETLANGSYYLEILAQSLFGDPTFQNEDYYSASSCSSSKVRFNVT
ncbi:MAG: hypothetical protein SPD11_09380 [Sphaerochaetaceae bacterium]|nr:hypothetical protein [Sphaerochaetaceae bacterium]